MWSVISNLYHDWWIHWTIFIIVATYICILILIWYQYFNNKPRLNSEFRLNSKIVGLIELNLKPNFENKLIRFNPSLVNSKYKFLYQIRGKWD